MPTQLLTHSPRFLPSPQALSLLTKAPTTSIGLELLQYIGAIFAWGAYDSGRDLVDSGRTASPRGHSWDDIDLRMDAVWIIAALPDWDDPAVWSQFGGGLE